MGMIARLKSFLRITRGGDKVPEVKVDTGAGYLVLAEHFQPAGDDGQPLPDDYALMVNVKGSGRSAAAGYLDGKNAGEAGPGERRLYSRDTDGTIKSVIWLKSDGSVTVNNGSGAITLQSDGTVNLNGVTINTAGEIDANKVSAPSVVASGKELAGHTHTPGTYANSGGPVSGVSGGNQ